MPILSSLPLVVSRLVFGLVAREKTRLAMTPGVVPPDSVTLLEVPTASASSR